MQRHFDHCDVAASPAGLAARVADWLLEFAGKSTGPFTIALAGGDTPKALYALLAAPAYRERFPWQRTHWFWGDERCVPHYDPASNYKMVCEAMLSVVPVSASNIHAVPTHLLPQAAAAAYERNLKTYYGADNFDPSRPLFDVMLLGLGADGHTASLFPRTDALDERSHWVAVGAGPNAQPRITLTYPALESTRAAAFLVAGASKQAMLQRLMAGDTELPAARLRPTGQLYLFADQAALGRATS